RASRSTCGPSSRAPDASSVQRPSAAPQRAWRPARPAESLDDLPLERSFVEALHFSFFTGLRTHSISPWLAYRQDKEECSMFKPLCISAAQERGAGAGGVGQGQQVEGRSDGGGSVGQTRAAGERGHAGNEADSQCCQERATARTTTQPPGHRGTTRRRG